MTSRESWRSGAQGLEGFGGVLEKWNDNREFSLMSQRIMANDPLSSMWRMWLDLKFFSCVSKYQLHFQGYLEISISKVI